MENQIIIGIVAGCIASFIVLIAILIFGGIRDVSQEEYGLAYNTFRKELDETVYTEGKHWLTIRTKMFKYNKVIIPIEISGIQCLTSNGIVITMNIRFQYQLIENELVQIFWEYGEEESLIVFMNEVAQKTLRDSCSAYLSSDFPERRNVIQNTMTDDLNQAFLVSQVHALVFSLELENYQFPDSLDRAIDRKQSALQDIITANNERDGELTSAETERLLAIIDANAIQIDADAEAEGILADAQAEADSIAEKWEKRYSVYNTIMTSMNMTSEEFVDEYLSSLLIHTSETPVVQI